MKNGVHLQGLQPFTRTIHGNVEYDMLRRNRYNINTLLVTNPLMPL